VGLPQAVRDGVCDHVAVAVQIAGALGTLKNIMKSVPVVRTIGVTALSLASTGFVQLYSWAARIRFNWEHHQLPSMNGAVWLMRYPSFGYLLPLFIGAAGSFCLIRRKTRCAALEIVLWIGILASVIWIGFALFVWELANVPIVSSSGVNY
jgi:hypothetical protein